MAMSCEPLVLDGQPLALDDVSSVARTGRAVQFGAGAQTAMQAARQLLERLAEDAEPIYGVNTGFGSLASVRIEPEAIREVQRN